MNKMMDREIIELYKNGIAKIKGMDIFLLEDKIDIYNDIARKMADKLRENNKKGLTTSFILPVGPRGQYRRFASICNRERISCKKLITINMDEYLDKSGNLVPMDHPLSFRGFMKENLFEILDEDLKILPENIHFPDPGDTKKIGNIVNDLNGADICFGGIGINGHIAFNEPEYDNLDGNGSYIDSRTRVLELKKETIVMNSLKYSGNMDLVPKKAITIGIWEIFQSKELCFYLDSSWKGKVFERTVFGDPTPSFPSTYLKIHRKSSITVSRNVLDYFFEKK